MTKEKNLLIPPKQEGKKYFKNYENIKFYDWNRIKDESTGLIISGPSGFGKSSIALAILGILTEDEPAEIFVFDNHAKKNNWNNYGLKAIINPEEIGRKLTLIKEELDKRKESETIEENKIIFIFDEINACYSIWKEKKLDFANEIPAILSRILSEGRKYNIFPILLNQSSNCADLNLSKPMRSNATQILLGAEASPFKEGTDELMFLKQQAYPCTISSAGSYYVAKHITHGEYKRRAKGKIPKGIKTINQKETSFYSLV